MMIGQGCRSPFVAATGLAFAVAVCLSGCGLASDPAPGQTGQAGTDVGPVAPPSPDTVAVRFRVLTSQEAVDVQFFATNDLLQVVPQDLFVSANAVSASIGTAGTGIVLPLSEDVILFPCTPTLTLGTMGGQFRDSETGELRGTGVSRWASEGPLGLCGTIVTFEFGGEEGARTTSLTVGR